MAEEAIDAEGAAAAGHARAGSAEGKTPETLLARCQELDERRNDEAARLLLERHKEAEAESKEARAEAMLKTAREEREMAQKERQDVEYNLGHTKDELGKAKNEYRQVLKEELKFEEAKKITFSEEARSAQEKARCAVENARRAEEAEDRLKKALAEAPQRWPSLAGVQGGSSGKDSSPAEGEVDVMSAAESSTESEEEEVFEEKEVDVSNMSYEERVDYAINQAGREGGGMIGRIAPIFHEILGSQCFVSLTLKESAARVTCATAVAYVVMKTIPEPLPDTISREWLADKNKQKFTYLDGEGVGSLVDLVVGKHGTTYPRKQLHKVDR